MKKFLFVAFLLSASTVMFAQNQGGQRQFDPAESAKRQTEWMKTELKLTAKQVAPVDSINLVYAKKQAELFQNRDGDREQRRQAMTELNTKKEAALSKVLTKEQLETYKKQAQERMGRRGGNRDSGGNRETRPSRNSN
jgi:hypothetical protein